MLGRSRRARGGGEGATWVRLRFKDRYAVDVRLATRARWVVSDASSTLFRGEMPPQQPGPKVEGDAQGLFGGSQLLDDLTAGKGTPSVTSVGKFDPRKPDEGVMQFRPIPGFDTVLRSAVGDGVWNLRRALVVSSASASDGLLGKLIESIHREVAL